MIVAVITSNLALADAPGNVALSRRFSKLPRASVVNVSQLLTVDRTRLTEHLGNLPTEVMRKVDSGLQLALAI